MNEHIEALKNIRADLACKIAAIDAAIDALTQLHQTPEQPTPEQQTEQRPQRKRRSKDQTPPPELDLSAVPDYNPGTGGGIRTDL